MAMVAAAAFAQQPAAPEPPAQQQDVPPPTTFRSTVDVVVAPVLVTDSNGVELRRGPPGIQSEAQVRQLLGP